MENMHQSSQLNAVESALLNVLYKAPGMTGDIVILLRDAGIEVSSDEAKRIGIKLNVDSYIKFIETESSIDAELMDRGVKYIADPERI